MEAVAPPSSGQARKPSCYRALPRLASWENRTVLRRTARRSRRAGLETHLSELVLYSGHDWGRPTRRGRRTTGLDDRPGPLAARHTYRQSKKLIYVNSHGRGQLGATCREYC